VIFLLSQTRSENEKIKYFFGFIPPSSYYLNSLQIYEEDSLDVLSGLKAKTSPGRPDWEKVCSFEDLYWESGYEAMLPFLSKFPNYINGSDVLKWVDGAHFPAKQQHPKMSTHLTPLCKTNRSASFPGYTVIPTSSFGAH